MRGFISKQIFTDEYINDDGIPVPGSTDWGADVECKYFANVSNSKGRYPDGVFKQMSFVITTEDLSFDAGVIRLKDKKGNVVCEKEVLSLEKLEAVQRIKITV